MKFTEGGEERWKPLESEGARCRVRLDGPDAACLTVDAPIPDLRYFLVYKPAQPGRIVSAKPAALAERLLDLARNDMAHGAAAVSLLTQSVGTATRLALQHTEVTDDALDAAVQRVRPHAATPSVLGLDGHWCGYLWHDARKVLLPAFGEFPPSLWGNDFGSGVGVVGHAFRFGASALWSGSAPADRPLRASLIFEKHRESQANVDWVVSVPILVAPGGRAIGAVAFAGPKPHGRQDSVGGSLARMARDMVGYEEARREGTADPEMPRDAIERQQRLLEAVNLFFWGAVAEGSLFAAEDRTYAKGALERLAPAAGAPAPAGAKPSAPKADAPPRPKPGED
jgi:hypothetical protein